MAASDRRNCGRAVSSEPITGRISIIEPDEVQKWSVRITSNEGFRRGDTIKYSLFRSSLSGTCTEDVFIDGARLLYD